MKINEVECDRCKKMIRTADSVWGEITRKASVSGAVTGPELLDLCQECLKAFDDFMVRLTPITLFRIPDETQIPVKAAKKKAKVSRKGE